MKGIYSCVAPAIFVCAVVENVYMVEVSIYLHPTQLILGQHMHADSIILAIFKTKWFTLCRTKIFTF